MGRTADTPNKVTAEVRGRLEVLIDGLINSIQIDDLNNSKKINYIYIVINHNPLSKLSLNLNCGA